MDRLFERLEIDEDDHETQASVESQAWSFFEALRRMTLDERNVVFSLIRFGCYTDMPDNVHINTDYLRRLTGKSVIRLTRLLSGLRSLGFVCSIRERTDEKAPSVHGSVLGDFNVFELSWSDLLIMETEYPALQVASEMVLGAGADCCDEHATVFLDRLDFSPLSKATVSAE